MSINDSTLAKYMKNNMATRVVLFILGLFLIGLGFFVSILWRSMGLTLYMGGVWAIATGLMLGLKKRYIIAVMAVGIVLVLAFWHNPYLVAAALGIIAGCILALVGKKPRPLLAKYQRKALFTGGWFFIAFAFYTGLSSGLGITSYIIGAYGVSAGVFLGMRDRYLILLFGVGLALGLGEYYNAPRLATESGIGIFLGAFSALFYSINNAGKAKKVRLAPPKPPFMASLMLDRLV